MLTIRILSIFIISFFTLEFSASSQSNTYVIFGNPDATPIYVCIDSDIGIELRVCSFDTAAFIHIPLASNDSIIVSRDGVEFNYPLTEWDDVRFLNPDPDSPIPGYTNQSVLGFCDIYGGPNPLLIPGGDTVLIADYFMHTTGDTAYLYSLVCPFMEGYNPANGGIIFGSGGVINPPPIPTFSCLFFVDYYPGDANGDGLVNGLDVVFLVSYFRGSGPTPAPMLAADANGDCMVNGVDVVYLVAYFKGGPEPFYGDCY
ncbi:MAG: dockerin type I repeat-containing protein [Candidatus Zixiibacteriota bacterium]|nr:MAG: dockerin type I repeat-containing protein [candidate division Zixibacteria bacterium]